MPNDLIATPQALGQASGGREPLSSLYREIGLAAVASGLNCSSIRLTPMWPRPSRGEPPCSFWRGTGPV